MNRYVWRLLVAALILGLLSVAPAPAQSPIEIQDLAARLEFPDRITFKAHIASNQAIDRVILEYGVAKLTCGTVVAKAFPDFARGTTADVVWTWEMRRSGSEPPGTKIWYRWRVADTSGNERVSEQHEVTWLDDQHPWDSVSSGKLTLHWYAGSRDFAMELLEAAVSGLEQLGQTTGVTLDAPTDMYIYASTDDMREAVLYEPGWTGGLAFPDHDIVIIGISPDQLAWGKRTEAHELTHVLVGHRTFSCLGSLPTWLNEGVAVYGEGGPDAVSVQRLSAAIGADRLISIRALSGGFSEDPGKADLSYSQSYSVVNFLVASFGQAKLIKLLDNLRDGMQIEDALNSAYGFGLDGLEQRWRTAVGAPPLRAEGMASTATALPTPIPTYQPIAAVPLAVAAGATVVPAQASATGPEPAAPVATSTAPTPVLPTWALAILVVGVVIVIGAILAARSFVLGRRDE